MVLNQPTNSCGCAAPLATSWLEPLRQKVQDLSGESSVGGAWTVFFSVGNFKVPKNWGEMESNLSCAFFFQLAGIVWTT